MRVFFAASVICLMGAGEAFGVPGPGDGGALSPAAITDAPTWNHWMGLGDALMANALEVAGQAYDRQDFYTAAAFYSVLIRVYPDDLGIQKRLGFALKETGHYEEGHDLLFQASVTDPADYLVWWWLSDTQRLMGDYKKSYDSMVTSRDAAPESEKVALQNYVDYTEMLGTNVPSWTVFEKHREFAKRHEKMHRLRRTIAEYMSALDTVPPTGPKAGDTPLRVAWVNNQIGIQYNQLKEPEVALDYFWRAIKAYESANSKADVMMAYQNLGVTYRLLADNTPARRAEFLELGVKYWGEAFKIAVERADVPYIRYARAGQLLCLAQARGLEDPETKAVREANLLELPWRGPLAEYTTASVALGELACRMHEGDFAGARVVGEMAVAFYSQSEFLLDSEETVRVRLQMAQAFTRQGHYDEAIAQADQAQSKLDALRRYMDSDSFGRSANRMTLRGIAVARVRAAVLKGDFTEAQRLADTYKLQARTDLLGSKVFDDAAKNDYVSEQELIKRRLAVLEKDLETANSGGAPEEATRLSDRVAADKERSAWLEKGLFFNASEAVNYRAVPVLGPMELGPTWPADTALITLLADGYGTVALTFDGKAAWGVALPETSQDDLRKLADVVVANALFSAPQDALPALDELGKLLLTPLHDHLAAKTLYFSVDGALADVPMELLREDGAFLLAAHDIAYVPSASYLIHEAGMARSGANAVRIACRGDGCGRLSAAVPGAVACDDEACVTNPVDAVKLMVIGGDMDLSVPDAMLASITLKAANGKDGELYAAELLGARAKADAVWIIRSNASGPWNPDAWSAIEEGLMQAGARCLIRTVLPLPDAAAISLLKATTGAPSVKTFSEAKRAALTATPRDLSPAFVGLSGVAE